MAQGGSRPGGLGHIEKVYTVAAAAPNNRSDSSIDSIIPAKDLNRGLDSTITLVVTHVDVKYLPSELVARDRGVPIRYVGDHNQMALEIEDGNPDGIDAI